MIKLASSVAALLAVSGVCFAQPPGVTPEMIATALPEEGAPLAVPGPYAVMSEPAHGSRGYIVFRPSDLGAFPTRDTMPLLVWGNGGCSIKTTRYGGFLSTIASHGFLVIGTAPIEGARGIHRGCLANGHDWLQQARAGVVGNPLRIRTRD